MPGSDVAYGPEYGVIDLYPKNEDEHSTLLTWCLTAFTAAEKAQHDYKTSWLKYDRQYSSFLEAKVGEWGSRVFVPYTFSVIETILPRMLAQPPKFVVFPVGPEDTEPAKLMEQLLEIATDHPDFLVELTKGMKSSLKYGTGILKTFHRKDVDRYFVAQPVMQPQYQTFMDPVMDPETMMPMRDPDGAPLMEERQMEVGQVETGEFQMVPQDYTSYDGPACEHIDNLDFFPAPEAKDIQNARYVIQRVWREKEDIEDLIAQKIYRLPENVDLEEVWPTNEEPVNERLNQLGRGPMQDDTRKAQELWEIWRKRDNVVITVLNRKAILRVHRNPFWHQQKPYVRLVDYLQESEFWGRGEAESIEGLQDLSNALTNQRIDNIRLVLNKMFAVNVDAIEDLADLRSRPGGVIRVKQDMDPRMAVMDISFEDVTSSAFTEAQLVQDLIERVTGVTAYTAGLDSASLNDTATGIALISDAGNTKFAMKVKLFEILALKPLARQFGSLIQQFTTAERVLRIAGAAGQIEWLYITPEGVQGALDYDIESSSSVQTESVRRDMALQKLQAVAPYWPIAVPKLIEDVIRSFGDKDVASYMMGSLGLETTLALLALQQNGGNPMASLGAPPQQSTGDTAEQSTAQGGVNPPADSQGGGQMMPPEAQMDPTMMGAF